MNNKTTISITIDKQILKEVKLKMVQTDMINRSELVENLLKQWLEQTK